MVSKICTDPGYTTLAFTMAPILITLLRLFRPSLRGFFTLIAIACLAYAATAFNEHSFATVFTIAASILTLLWKLITWCIIRCRLCRLGPRYITAPSSFIESTSGTHAINAGSTAVVSRRQGFTLAQGSLVPDVKKMVLNGKVAARKGLVTLRRYGWKTR
ncbi:ORF8 protein [Simian hemorrhagic encephalitis virus]|uniref:ORF8 protein n=1 Tax=Simian hemorrhagic encephalitis virus TaxID=1965068 RepID=A0A0F6PU06_9NIDO|nr:ORF8 protein [Simian hemorrhagic encephalitis virus]AKC89302.1 ORF8 protein [Simian hemorrhagic encephalitis virus]